MNVWSLFRVFDARFAALEAELETVRRERDRAQAEAAQKGMEVRSLRRQLDHATKDLQQASHPSVAGPSLRSWMEDVAAVAGTRPVLWFEGNRFVAHVAGVEPTTADDACDALSKLFDRVLRTEAS